MERMMIRVFVLCTFLSVSFGIQSQMDENEDTTDHPGVCRRGKNGKCMGRHGKSADARIEEKILTEDVPNSTEDSEDSTEDAAPKAGDPPAPSADEQCRHAIVQAGGVGPRSEVVLRELCADPVFAEHCENFCVNGGSVTKLFELETFAVNGSTGGSLHDELEQITTSGAVASSHRRREDKWTCRDSSCSCQSGYKCNGKASKGYSWCWTDGCGDYTDYWNGQYCICAEPRRRRAPTRRRRTVNSPTRRRRRRNIPSKRWDCQQSSCSCQSYNVCGYDSSVDYTWCYTNGCGDGNDILNGAWCKCKEYSTPNTLGYFYVIAHQTNNAATIDWAVLQGANALEIDTIYAEGSDGFYPKSAGPHFNPCDCSCAPFPSTDHLCKYANGCADVTDFATLLQKVAGTSQIKLVHFDNKIGHNYGSRRRSGYREFLSSTDDYQTAGTNFANLVKTNLFDKGYSGRILVGTVAKAAFPEAVLAVFKTTTYVDNVYFSYEAEADGETELGYEKKVQLSEALDTENVAHVSGISSCSGNSNEGYYDEVRWARKDDKFKLIIGWTVDKQSSASEWMYAGVNGIITNVPRNVVQAYDAIYPGVLDKPSTPDKVKYHLWTGSHSHSGSSYNPIVALGGCASTQITTGSFSTGQNDKVLEVDNSCKLDGLQRVTWKTDSTDAHLMRWMTYQFDSGTCFAPFTMTGRGFYQDGNGWRAVSKVDFPTTGIWIDGNCGVSSGYKNIPCFQEVVLEMQEGSCSPP